MSLLWSFISVNYYDVEVRCAFFTNACIVITTTSNSLTNEVARSTFPVCNTHVLYVYSTLYINCLLLWQLLYYVIHFRR